MSDPVLAEDPTAAGDPGARRGSTPSPAGTLAGPPAQSTSSTGFVQRGDRLFRWLCTGAGASVLALIASIAVFLLIQAVPPLLRNNGNFLLGRTFDTDPANLDFGILDLLLVTVEVSAFALVLAMPVGLGIALYLTQYAPRRLARAMSYVVDLLAAVPSIIFGLWGLFVLAPVLRPFAELLNRTLGWIFLFGDGNVPIARGANLFTAGIVLAVMILPIITAITREVFDRTPRANIEGALALGATRWEVVRTAVLPFGRAGYVSASMLGLGRALGETIALMIVLAATPQLFGGSLFDGGATFASRIALAFAELNNALSAGAYIAAGLVLFVLTFVVNAIARAIVNRYGVSA